MLLSFPGAVHTIGACRVFILFHFIGFCFPERFFHRSENSVLCFDVEAGMRIDAVFGVILF